jgi:hypothetical protein
VAGTEHREGVLPALPVGEEKKHLAWIIEGFKDIDETMNELHARAPSAPRFRWRGLFLRFHRDDGPSAYAFGWSIAYNLEGALNKSPEAVRDTLLHEVFHLSDAFQGNVSRTELGPSHRHLRAVCEATQLEALTPRASECLAPYAPTSTFVRGGTFYAFYGPEEYGAELAVRYFREQRAALRGERHVAFKCGPPENGRAWAMMRGEFFGGLDLTSACP